MFDWDNEKSNAKDWAKTYKGTSIMYEGIATYKDESVYLSKDTLKRVMPELKGRPVIIKHKLGINPGNMENYAVGYVTKCEYNNETGDFDCDFVIWDEEAKSLLNNGYTLSTGYKAKDFNSGGTYINTPYDREITDLEFTHLAIAKNPRYEKVKVYQNSTEDEEDKETKSEKQNNIIEEKEYHMDKIEVEQGFLAKLMDMASKKFTVQEKQNSSDDDTFEYEGKIYSKSELVNSFEQLHAKEEIEEEDDAKGIIDEEEEKEEEKPEEKGEKQNSSDVDWFEVMQEKLNSIERGEDDKIQPVQTREKALEKGRKIYG